MSHIGRSLTWPLLRRLAPGILIIAACGDNTREGDTGPFAEVPVTATVKAPGLDGQVDVVRDEHGIPHVYATTLADAGFGMGYTIAGDRLPQMDLFRHVAEGRIAEL